MSYHASGCLLLTQTSLLRFSSIVVFHFLLIMYSIPLMLPFHIACDGNKSNFCFGEKMSGPAAELHEH
jgi:hypothetical protein